MAEGSLIYRPSLAQLSYGAESTYNDTTVGEGTNEFLFGLTPDEVDLPDPEIDWMATRSAGYGADVHIHTEGPRTLTGSIPITLQDGQILKYVLGASNDSAAPAPYTHTITGAEVLPSMCIEAVWNDGTDDWLRYYTGVKCSGATLAAEEDGMLKCNVGVEAAYVQESSAAKTDLGTLEDEDPYMFYNGTCSFWGTEFARVQSWDLDIKRALTARRYIQDSHPTYPYEINEGARDITLSATLVAANDSADGTEAFEELMSPTSGGFDIELVMNRGASDTMTITNPTDQKCVLKSAKHPRHAAGAEDAPITVEIIMRGVQVVVVDNIAEY